MSLFVKRGAARSADAGTRPGLHGQTLVSLGLVDLDRLMGGGLPLGTLTLVLEDKHSQQHDNLVRYFLAEGVTTGQRALWVCPPGWTASPDAFLPAPVSPTDPASSSGRGSSKDGAPSAPSSSGSSSSSQQQGGSSSSAPDQELRIAWQYRKYLDGSGGMPAGVPEAGGSRQAPGASTSAAGASQAAASKRMLDAGVGREWCHTYDLTRSMGAERLKAARLACHACASGQPLHEAAAASAAFIAGFGAPVATAPGGFPLPVAQGPESVGRLVVQSLGSPAWQPPCAASCSEAEGGWGEEERAWRSVAQVLLALRLAVQDKRCAAVVTCQAYLFPEAWQVRLLHLCDAAISLEAISDASPVWKLLPDPASAAALLSLRKLPSAGMLCPRLPDPQLYVVRNKRRRLAITPVEVDPQAEEREQAALASRHTGSAQHGQGAGLDF